MSYLVGLVSFVGLVGSLGLDEVLVNMELFVVLHPAASTILLLHIAAAISISAIITSNLTPKILNRMAPAIFLAAAGLSAALRRRQKREPPCSEALFRA